MFFNRRPIPIPMVGLRPFWATPLAAGGIGTGWRMGDG